MEDININDLEELLSPQAEFKASDTLKDSILEEVRKMSLSGAGIAEISDNDLSTTAKVVRLKPKIRRGWYVAAASAVAACVLFCFMITRETSAPSADGQQVASTSVIEKDTPKNAANAPTQVSDEPLEAAHIAEDKRTGHDEDVIEVDVENSMPVVDTIPFVNPQMMDDCIAQLSSHYNVKPETFNCSEKHSADRTEMAYNFPDEKGNNITSQLIMVASKYIQENKNLNFVCSTSQFVMQLHNGRIDSPVIDTWEAKRTNGRIIIYRTHSIGFESASSACLIEYKDRNINMQGDIL